MRPRDHTRSSPTGGPPTGPGRPRTHQPRETPGGHLNALPASGPTAPIGQGLKSIFRLLSPQDRLRRPHRTNQDTNTNHESRCPSTPNSSHPAAVRQSGNRCGRRSPPRLRPHPTAPPHRHPRRQTVHRRPGHPTRRSRTQSRRYLADLPQHSMARGAQHPPVHQQVHWRGARQPAPAGSASRSDRLTARTARIAS